MAPLIFNVTGNYTERNTLRMDIGGNTPGDTASNHSQIAVSGYADIAGATLNIKQFNGYAPARADTYQIIIAAHGIHGFFTSVTSDNATTIFLYDKNPSSPFFQNAVTVYGTGLAAGQTFVDLLPIGSSIQDIQTVQDIWNNIGPVSNGVITVDSSTPLGVAAINFILNGLPVNDLTVTATSIPVANTINLEVSWPSSPKARSIVTLYMGNIFYKVITGNTYTFENLAQNIPYTVRVQVNGDSGIVHGITGVTG